MSYDMSGNLISTTDAEGVVAQAVTYDTMNRVASSKDALGVTTTYSYDTMGNLIQAVKALNEENSRKTAYTVTYVDGSYLLYTYDDAWKVKSIKDRTGAVTTYEYDAKGNMQRTSTISWRHPLT